MYYCTNCHRVTPERAESCPYCDKFDRLRPAEEADECRLTELDALNASVLESLLKEANVPYIARPMMGAGISAALGVTLEKFVFFVAYRDYARAQELLELGLSVPQVTQIFLKLRQMGLDIPADVYTIPYAVKTIQKALAAKQGGGANA